ncbi:hypothetical protein NGA_0607410 [Nannochloropsis gaditana CCMP526]|uniref:uncharacterized protein n=1 Tax=Nannochloropsis gaditana (strain CCMP526) TaxID=1093141 RepID=UPI00029F795B|nr:hypothetical protein NGA_0607410 [Nannochloropsis gaditana CCMP526]EKU20786.1 hypothetical protein NGA_0607410 [Nannochloropsis gaditana CCMP526]|eukprot:XP_005855571.1 hypothetical protein NGA_0607410 [Nannochloropsis gaditana CCMP526]
MVMPSIVMKYFTLFIVFAASARADCPPDGALQVAVSTSKTRVRRGGVTMFTLTLQQVTDWGNATAIYPALILPVDNHTDHDHDTHHDHDTDHDTDHDHDHVESARNLAGGGGGHEHEHAPAYFRSGRIKPRIWKRSRSNRPIFEAHDSLVYFMLPSDYATSVPNPRPSASAPEHAFRFDVVVGKTLEEDHLEFDLVILDGLDGNICFGPEHVEIDVYGRIRPERDH